MLAFGLAQTSETTARCGRGWGSLITRQVTGHLNGGKLDSTDQAGYCCFLLRYSRQALATHHSSLLPRTRVVPQRCSETICSLEGSKAFLSAAPPTLRD